MQTRSITLSRILLASAGTACVVGCSQEAHELGRGERPLTAECKGTEAIDELPSDAWVCPEARTVECTSGTGRVHVDTLYVPDTEGQSCADTALSVSHAGPFAPGQHTISVTDAEGAELCSATLNVVDTTPPELTEHTIQLWPPNHKFHTIAVEDCVSFVDACAGEIRGEFIWATSDEPEDDKGDGHHAPDIVLDDCGHVRVRAERAGPKNGRVYTLGVRVVDGGGNAVEGACKVIVDHDQRGVQGMDDGESYRIVFDGSQGGPACDGVADDPPTSEPPPSDDPPADEPPPSDEPPEEPPPADPVPL